MSIDETNNQNSEVSNDGWDSPPPIPPAPQNLLPEESKPHPVQVVEIQRTKKSQTEIITAWATVAAVLLSGYAVFQTNRSLDLNKASNDSTIINNRISQQLAQATFDSSIAFNNISMKAQAEENKSSEEEARRRTRIDSINLQIQISSLKHAHKEFINAKKNYELENTPYIQLEGFILDTFSTNQQIHMTANALNMGKFPIKIINTSSNISINNTDPSFDQLKGNLSGDNFFNMYITASKSYTLYMVSNFVLDNRLVNLLTEKNTKTSLFIYGFINYVNLLTNKKRQYKFMYKFCIPERSSFCLINENYDLN